jgi:hypothetical protein
MTVTERAPMVGAEIWEPVMASAGHRCQCEGECGQKHTKTEGRCGHVHGGYLANKKGHIKLLAASRDVSDAFPPPADLIAWCPPCYDGARRGKARELKAAPLDMDPLFEIEAIQPGRTAQPETGRA